MAKLSHFLLLISTGCVAATLPSLSSLMGPSSLMWEGGSIDFITPSIKNMFVNTKHYVQKNVIMSKFVTHLDTIIALAPRFKSGNPSSVLSYKVGTKATEPQFTPYPSLSSHEVGNCDAIQNAVDFYLDRTGLLWVLDSGIIDTMEHPKQTCPSKIVCISVLSGQITKSIDLSEYVESESNLYNIVADYDAAGNAFIYVSDAGSGKVFIYDITKSRGFKVEFPNEIIHKRNSEEPLYMLLTREAGGSSALYLTYLNSPCIFSINTKYLRSGKSEGKITKVAKKVAPMVFLGTDNGKKLYYRYKGDQKVYAWDTTTSFTPNSLAPVYTSDECFVPTCVTFDVLRNTVKILESNLFDYLSGNCGAGALHQIIKL